MGSDYLFISKDMSKPTLPMAGRYGRNSSPEGYAKRRPNKKEPPVLLGIPLLLLGFHLIDDLAVGNGHINSHILQFLVGDFHKVILKNDHVGNFTFL